MDHEVGYTWSMTARIYDDATTKKVREFLWSKMVDHGGEHTRTSLGRDMGCSDRTVQAFLAATNGLGPQIARGIEKVFGVTVDQIAGKTGDDPTPLRLVEGWDQAVARAKELHALLGRVVPDHAYDAAGQLLTRDPRALTPESVYHLALALWDQTSQPALTEQIVADRRARNAKRAERVETMAAAKQSGVHSREDMTAALAETRKVRHG